jgi:hypothetical protein
MDLVKRYVAAVQRELPENKREEIGRELNANIMDQLDALTEQQGRLTDADIAAVLKQMGHPRTVARQFVPLQPLISANYMPLYKNTLFMVLGILFLLQVVDSTSAWLTSANMGLLGYLFNLARGFLQDVLLGFTSITLAYALISHQQSATQRKCNEGWQPENLPAASAGWQHVSLHDVFTDLATYVFLLIVIWYPLWLSDKQLADNHFLLTEQTRQFLQWASPLALLGIANSLWQLRMRLWSQPMLVANVIINTGFAATMLLLASSGPLLKPEPQFWHGVFELHQVERAVSTSLLIMAMIPTWEVLRDLWRLKRLR